MAHELDRKPDGSATMFSVRKTPWHKLGSVLNTAPTLAQALSLSGASFAVEKRPVMTSVAGVDDDVVVSIRGAYAVVRTDRNEVLGIVGERYTPLQNSEAFDVLEPLIEQDRATLETGGVLRGGEDVWLMARFRLPDDSIAQSLLGDEVAPYFLLANNHSGKRGVLCVVTPVRVVCANTLAIAREKGKADHTRAFTVSHSTNVVSRTWQAAESLYTDACERIELAAKQYQLMQHQILNDHQWNNLVLDVATPMPKPPRSPRDAVGIRRWEIATARRARLSWLWTSGTGHTGDRSAWEGFQAVTESLDHDRGLWSPGKTLDQQVTSLYDGSLRGKKEAVLQCLYDHCLQAQ